MGDNDTLTRKPRKFLFDTHNFDEDEEDIVETVEEPPPPTFSEDELKAAQEQAYQNGRQEALAEAEKSRAQFVATLTDRIGRDLSTLFAAEDTRSRLYETEAVRLSVAIFEKLFPFLNESKGLEEIRKVITSVLQQHSEEPEILITVHPDYAGDIEKHIKNNLTGGKVTVNGDEKLGPGDCRLSWKDGGAHRQADALADHIRKHLQQSLDGKQTLADNKVHGADQNQIQHAEPPMETDNE